MCFGDLWTTLHDFACDCWGLGEIWVRRPRAYSCRIRAFARRVREYPCRISEMAFNCRFRDPILFSFGRPCLHFGILGGPGTIQEHLGAQERSPWGSCLGFLLILNRFRAPILRAFWVPWTFECCWKLRFGFLCGEAQTVIFAWPCRRILGLRKQAFGVGGVAKTHVP